MAHSAAVRPSESALHQQLRHAAGSAGAAAAQRWAAAHPLMVRARIFEGARKWMGPWLGCVFMRFRRNLSYFIFCRTSPPEMQISSHLTTACSQRRVLFSTHLGSAGLGYQSGKPRQEALLATLGVSQAGVVLQRSLDG